MKCFVFYFIVFLATISDGEPCCEKKMIIDHDGGGDDAEAILLALLNEKYFDGPCVVALTVTFGNVNLSQAIINSERILELANRTDIPIYAGAKGPLISGIETDHFFGDDGLGDEKYHLEKQLEIQKFASMALIELSKKYEGDLTVVAIGPATNLALAIRLDPGFLNRLSHLFYGGGNIPSETSKPEFNVAMDPEAYYIVTETAKVCKVTLVPMSRVKQNLNISKKWRLNVFGTIQTPIVQALNGFQRIAFENSPDATYLDPAVVAIALDANIAQEFKDSYSSGILCGNDRGTSVYNFYSPHPNSRVFYKGDDDTYKQFLLDVFSAELDD